MMLYEADIGGPLVVFKYTDFGDKSIRDGWSVTMKAYVRNSVGSNPGLVVFFFFLENQGGARDV